MGCFLKFKFSELTPQALDAHHTTKFNWVCHWLNPSYTKLFRTYTLTKGGRSSGPPYFLINTWLYIPQILQGIRDTLQGLRKHKVCKKSFVWLPWQLFDNIVLFTNNCQVSMKNRYFSNAPRNHKLEGAKTKFCVLIVLFLYVAKK